MTGERGYVMLCLVALVGLLLTDVEQGLGLGSLLVFLVGVVGVLTRMRSAPLLFLLVLAVQQTIRHQIGSYYHGRPGQFTSPELFDVVRCLAVLVFVMAHYRLQGMVSNVVPLDPRRLEGPPRWHFWRLGWLPRPALERRSEKSMSPREIPLLLVTVAAAVVTVQAVWGIFTLLPAGLHLPIPLWRLLILAWVIGISVFVSAAVLQHWRQRQMAPAEATLMLQDVLWTETRREQRRINRWLAWAHLRKSGRGKKGSDPLNAGGQTPFSPGR